MKPPKKEKEQKPDDYCAACWKHRSTTTSISLGGGWTWERWRDGLKHCTTQTHVAQTGRCINLYKYTTMCGKEEQAEVDSSD